MTHYAWSFYNPLVMPDLTEDGVPEVLFAHGGDGQFLAKVRQPQCVILCGSLALFPIVITLHTRP